MILALLICFVNCLQTQAQSSKKVNSSTGEIIQSDSSKVLVPIGYIKDANAKMLERNYLIKAVNLKDSIIALNKSYVAEQLIIIKGFQTKVVDLTTNNNALVKALNNETKSKRLFLGTTIGAIAVAVAIVFIK